MISHGVRVFERESEKKRERVPEQSLEQNGMHVNICNAVDSRAIFRMHSMEMALIRIEDFNMCLRSKGLAIRFQFSIG